MFGDPMTLSSRTALRAALLAAFAFGACGTDDEPSANTSADGAADVLEGDAPANDVEDDPSVDTEMPDAGAPDTEAPDAGEPDGATEDVSDDPDAEDTGTEDVADTDAPDTATDAEADTEPDAETDSGDDVGTDVRPDITEDVATDTMEDATADVAPDTTADVGDDCLGVELPIADIRGTEGLEILPDGTTFFSQSESIGIWTRDGGVDTAWATIPRATTIWGLGYRALDNTLLVATPSNGGQIIGIEIGPTPRPTVIASDVGAPNGLTVGPDGNAYFTDFSGGVVYLLDPANRIAPVTDSAFRQPNGVYVDDDGTLLVLSYATGEISRVTLSEGSASDITVVASISGAPDGITRDADGNYYVSDNVGGTIHRFDARFGNETIVARDIAAAANLVFGRGALTCNTLYVASSGRLGAVVTDSRYRDRATE